VTDSSGLDAARPTYHFSSGNWMNDVIPFHDGERTHVYFDHNPTAPTWTAFSWGHASTADLVTWSNHPVALSPSGPDDAMGCWTGTVFADGDTYRAAYTGIRAFQPLVQTQCLATSADLDRWDQQAAAIIDAPPEGYGECFRDPFVFRHDGEWRMLVGSTVDGDRAAVALYASDDLERWRFLGPFFADRSGDLGTMAECPELFMLGGRTVLVSSCATTKAVVGYLDDDGRFVRDGPITTFDPGDSYAAKSVDVGGRRIQFAWLRDTRDRPARELAGWSGALSLPRRMTMGEGGSIRVAAADELTALRVEEVHEGPVRLTADAVTIVEGPASHAVEAIVDINAGARLAALVGCEPDGSGGVEIDVDANAGTVAGFDIDHAPDADLELRIYLDHSVVEVFTCGRVITRRRYELSGAPRLGLRCADSPSTATVAAWHLEPPWRG
jgi:beta-fructofuranosidase